MATRERQQSVRELTAVKEQTFLKSYRNDIVIDIEEWKETQAVHPSQDYHGNLEPGPMKTRPTGMSKDVQRLMARKSSQLACVDDHDEKYHNDSYSAHDMRAEEARRRGSKFKDLLIRPAHMIALDEARRYSRSSLWGGSLSVGERTSLAAENSKTGQYSQTRATSLMDRRNSSVSLREARRKSSLVNAIAFNRTSILTEVRIVFHNLHASSQLPHRLKMIKGRGKSLQQISEEQTNQAHRESKMDAMGTCSYVKVRHILSEKLGLITDVYNQLQKGWLAYGNHVPPKDFGKLAEKYSECKSSKVGGDLGWVPRAKPGTAGPFQEVAFSTPVGSTSAVFHSSQGFHIILVEARKN